ncbi:hypothetical protein [Desulfovibrio desulfuricans]|uniref:hypothetical protein n=1 Tax=Desulfovibrio desulfuricans TaxID=876 RepID=UPI0003B4D984|nr:hypothetical protein [Desulfovibrio desulfuricans]
MTLPYSPSRAVYEGNGAATAFPFAFKVWSTNQLNISITSPKGETSPAQGWTASIGESGGTVTYLHDGAPLPAGWRLAIVRNMPFEQGIDLISASRFDPQVIEDGLDQATAELQQLNEKLARAVIMPATSDKSPEEVVASIYSSRDAAAQNATAAAHSAAAAAASAATAAQTVAEAAEASVSAATAQADIAAANAQTAQTAAHAAQQAVPDNLLSRMVDAEVKNTQQDTRLNGVESGITAVSTTLIGSIMSVMAAEGYVPNGTVPADAAEYTREQFREFYDTYLAGGKLLTCTYAAFAAQVALTGNCAKFALDTTAQKFKVPLLKNGDSITQAASASELGKSYKAGLPNITGNSLGVQAVGGPSYGGALYSFGSGGATFGQSGGGGWNSIGIDASRSSPIYGNSNTVTTEGIRLRHFVVLASAQNSASVFDWSNYMAGLAGKANLDMDNLTPAGSGKVANYAMPSQRVVAVAVPASGGYTVPAPSAGWFKLAGVSTAAGQYIRLSTASYVVDILDWSSGPGQSLGIMVPVRKGDAVWASYSSLSAMYMHFVITEGGN